MACQKYSILRYDSYAKHRKRYQMSDTYCHQVNLFYISLMSFVLGLILSADTRSDLWTATLYNWKRNISSIQRNDDESIQLEQFLISHMKQHKAPIKQADTERTTLLFTLCMNRSNSYKSQKWINFPWASEWKKQENEELEEEKNHFETHVVYIACHCAARCRYIKEGYWFFFLSKITSFEIKFSFCLTVFETLYPKWKLIRLK